MKTTGAVLLTLVLCLGLFAGCGTQPAQEVSDAKAIYPLPETLAIDALDNCSVAVSFKKGDVYTDGKKTYLRATVYTYELYDMVDIATLAENDEIFRQNEKVKVTQLARLDSGLVRINGGEENGGFDLISNDSTVYYEIGMNDAKAYYALGEVTLPLADGFVYTDASDLDAEAKTYTAEVLLAGDENDYHFVAHNTSIVIENGAVTHMNRVYMP